MWRTRLPLGLLVAVASCQPTGDGNETDPLDPLADLPPISDFPRSSGGVTVSPVVPGNAPPVTAPTSPGGTATADPRAPGMGGTVGAGSAPPAVNPAPTSPAGGGGGAPGAMDAGAPVTSGDAGFMPPLGTADDAGAGDGGAPDANGDAGCPRLRAPDSGICSAYGCGLSLDQLRASANSAGACTSPAALAAACDGSASSAALRCTEASVFSPDLGEAASACVKRDAQLSALGATCLDCFVDEALCTLSRCFSLCALASENDACRDCRHKQCGGALSQCTGLPAP